MRRAYEFGLTEGNAFIRDGVVRIEPFVQVDEQEPEPPQDRLLTMLLFLCGSLPTGLHLIVWGVEMQAVHALFWSLASLCVGWRLSNYEDS